MVYRTLVCQKEPPLILELMPDQDTHMLTSSLLSTDRWSSQRQQIYTIRAHSTHTPHRALVTGHASGKSRKTEPMTSQPQPLVYPNILEDDVDDVSALPRSPTMIMSRDNPWVYRYKVKRSMNELSKILASKPPVKLQSNMAATHIQAGAAVATAQV